MPTILRGACRLASLLALSCFASSPATTFGEEEESNGGLAVEIWWASDETFPVDRMMLVSADREEEAKVWQDARRYVDLLEDLPGFEESDLIEAGTRWRHVVVLTPAECEALYGALQKQPASDRERHYGYDAMIRLNGNIAWRKLGTRAETCKFLRDVSAGFQPETAQAISRFTDSVDAMPGGAQGRTVLPGSGSVVPAPAPAK